MLRKLVLVFSLFRITNGAYSERNIRLQFLTSNSRCLEDERIKIVAFNENRIQTLKDDFKYFDEDENEFRSNHVSYSGQQQRDQYDYTVETVDVQRALNPLLKQANTASIGLLFILLIWRTLACFEMADQFHSVAMRTLTRIPAIA